MLPFFYESQPFFTSQTATLGEATSKHCVQVLRMTNGDQLILTDGKGNRYVASIVAADRKKCIVTILESQVMAPFHPELSIGIAFTKNKNRNEWFLEKATEIGIRNIFPLLTEHSEKTKFNLDRYRLILVAAMLQSQQYYLPELQAPQKLPPFLKSTANTAGQKLIAHCSEHSEKINLLATFKKGANSLILIGPEGDFTTQEIEACLQSGFIPVTLGQRRLRTETAGIYACSLFNAFQNA